MNINYFEHIQAPILLFFQSIRNPILNILFLFFTISTETPVVVVFTAIMYWCIDKKIGRRMLYALTGNIALNGAIKDYFKVERPIGKIGLESMRVETATGYSFPSGHTQTATTFWTSLAVQLKKKWVYVLAVVMAVGAGISRLYLAVHWPMDVVVGLILGILFTILLIKIMDRSEKSGKYWEMILILVPLAIMAFVLKSSDYTKLFALMFGFTVGYILEREYVSFEVIDRKNMDKSTAIKKNIKRFLVGMLSLGIVYLGLKLVFSLFGAADGSTLDMVLDFVRYSVVVIQGVAGAPYLFKKMGI